MELNYRGIAVPLLDRNNDVHGAISITMQINQEVTEDAVARVLPVLQDAARAMRPLIWTRPRPGAPARAAAARSPWPPARTRPRARTRWPGRRPN